MKSHFFTLVIIFGHILLLCGQSSEFSATGFDVMRIENEIKLSVPNAISDSLWKYLITRYNNSDLFLRAYDSTFTTKTAEDVFVDQYYDNHEMELLKRQYGIRHRSRYVLTDSNDRKNGRQLLQFKINDIGDNELNRAEYKYKIKNYGKPAYALDAHPFFYHIEREQRENVASRLWEYHINAFELFPTIKIVQNRKRVYISHQREAFATMTLDQVTASFQGKSERFIELELELNEINYTEGDSTTRAKMEEINALIKDDLLTAFPTIHQDQTPKYNKGFMALGLRDFSYRPLFGLTEGTLSLGLFALLGLGALFLLRGRKNNWMASNDLSAYSPTEVRPSA